MLAAGSYPRTAAPDDAIRAARPRGQYEGRSLGELRVGGLFQYCGFAELNRARNVPEREYLGTHEFQSTSNVHHVPAHSA